MSNSGDFSKSFAAEVDSDIEVEQVVVGTDRATDRIRRGNPLSVLALLAGVVFLVADVFVITRFPTWFFAKTVPATISLLLMLASLVACLALIVHSLAMRRADRDFSGDAHRGGYARSVGVPLLLALLAPLLTVWSLNVSKSVADRAVVKPCIEVYQQAAGVAKDNPKFRMPAKDRDEVRCTVNAVLGR